MSKKLFVIDDDPQLAELLREVAEISGYDAQVHTNAREFFERDADIADVILLDLNMPIMDGVEVIRELAHKRSESAIILISGYDSSVLHSAQKLAQEHQLKVVASLTKPMRPMDLKHILSNLKLDIPTEELPIKSRETPAAGELKEAIHTGQLILYYQPQINLKDGSLAGAEALVRWMHPERGIIGPDTFVPLAEQNKLIGELTTAIIVQAMEQSRLWKEMGLSARISVNVSSDNITSLTLPEQLSGLVNSNELNPSLLVLEITESALMSQLITSLDILTRLRMKGFHLSIDDFGTGYSSLSQLHRVPFTELKIDKSFISHMDQDAEAHAIVETCIMLGHKLNMKIVAEGVETPIVKDMLTEMGCDTAQGYLFARPMPAQEMQDWVRKK